MSNQVPLSEATGDKPVTLINAFTVRFTSRIDSCDGPRSIRSPSKSVPAMSSRALRWLRTLPRGPVWPRSPGAH